MTGLIFSTQALILMLRVLRGSELSATHRPHGSLRGGSRPPPSQGRLHIPPLATGSRNSGVLLRISPKTESGTLRRDDRLHSSIDPWIQIYITNSDWLRSAYGRWVLFLELVFTEDGKGGTTRDNARPLKIHQPLRRKIYKSTYKATKGYVFTQVIQQFTTD